MNKLKALITTIILGTSAAAFAAPMHQPEMQQSWRRQTAWTTLASSAKISGTVEYIKVSPRAARFDQLKLTTLSGKTQIKLVQINFANGGSQVVRLNTQLSKSNTTATIDLTGQNRQISGIVVYGSSNARGAYQILAA